MRNQLIKQALALIAVLQAFIKKEQQKKYNKPMENKREALYKEAVKVLGTDASPFDLTSDELGCIDSLTNVISKVIPQRIMIGTWTFWDYIKKDPRFQEIREHEAKAGDIIISPTGESKIPKEKRTIRHGHAGIWGENDKIMSNDSATGQ